MKNRDTMKKVAPIVLTMIMIAGTGFITNSTADFELLKKGSKKVRIDGTAYCGWFGEECVRGLRY
jgi:hypothetical protein